MAETAATAPEGTEEPAPQKPSMVVTLAVVLGALAAGAGAGMFVLAPKLVGSSAPAAEADPEADAEAADTVSANVSYMTIGNLIVNPRGSQGNRFLMVSVALAATPAASDAKLRKMEVPIRDMVTGVLEVKTLEMLTTPGARDSIRVEIARVVERAIGKPAKVTVYLPQYVIQ